MPETYSQNVTSFLDFLEQAQNIYSAAVQEERDCELKTQDLLHQLEIGKNTYYEQAKLAKAIASVRQDRRYAKDTKDLLNPIILWINKKESRAFIQSLRGLEYDLEKTEEKYTDTERHYHYRTSIVEEAIGRTEDL